MITAEELRQQAKSHRDAAVKLEEAASVLDSFGSSKTVPQSKVENRESSQPKTQGFNATDGVRKNQDLCFEVLKKAGKPMKVEDLTQAIKERGSLITVPSTVTLYLRHDEQKRFTRPKPGVWALSEQDAMHHLIFGQPK